MLKPAQLDLLCDIYFDNVNQSINGDNGKVYSLDQHSGEHVGCPQAGEQRTAQHRPVDQLSARHATALML